MERKMFWLLFSVLGTGHSWLRATTGSIPTNIWNAKKADGNTNQPEEHRYIAKMHCEEV